MPVWGNRLDRRVQIRKRSWLLKEMLDFAGLTELTKLPKELLVLEEEPIPLPEPPELSFSELVAEYRVKGRGRKALAVEPHRLGFAQVQALQGSTLAPEQLTANVALWQEAGLDLLKAVQELGEAQGNVSYEEVDCLGLDINREQLGGIRDDDIDNSSGLTLPTALFDNGLGPDVLLRPCPFAGRVVITGPPFPGHLYRIQVRQLPGGGWNSVANPFTVQPLTGPAYTKTPALGDYFSYESFVDNPDLTLAWWESGGDELWEVKLDIFGVSGSVTQRVRLKNSGVEAAEVDIVAGGNCGRFGIGTTLNGTFVARDPYLAGYSLDTSPFAAPAGQLVPTSGNVQTPVAGSPWSLDTPGMKACGYVVNLLVSDRAIVNSHGARHHRSAAVGFCLLSPDDL